MRKPIHSQTPHPEQAQDNSLVRCSRAVRPDRAIGGKSISYDDMQLVWSSVRKIVPDWSMEIIFTGPGDSTLIIMPKDADDAIGPIFMLYQEEKRFCLDQFHWDELNRLGEHETLREALTALESILTSYLLPSSGPSTLRH